jgi:head-tail adaptor
MAAGQFRHLVTIEQQTETEDGFGNVVDGAWAPLGTDPTWYVSMTPGLGGERDEAKGMAATQQMTFRGWHRSDVTTRMRLVLGSRTFNIGAVRNVDGRDRYLEVDGTEKV